MAEKKWWEKGVMDFFGDDDDEPSPSDIARGELFATLAPGSPVSRLSPGQEASLTALEQMSQRLAGGTGPEAETFALGRNTLADVLSQAGPTFERYFQQSVADPMLQFFSERLRPQLDVELGRSGFFGSARERALGSASERLLRSLTEQRAGLSKDLLETRMRGAQLAPGLAAPEIDAFTKLLSGTDFRRQAEIDRIKLLQSLLGYEPAETSEPNQLMELLRIAGPLVATAVGGPAAGAAAGAVTSQMG